MPIPVGESAITRRRVQDDVYDALLAAIVGGELAPGERLDDRQLIAWSGASRVIVRESIARLSRSGFVTAGQGHLTHVTPINGVTLNESAVVYKSLLVHATRQITPSLTVDERQSLTGKIRSLLPGRDSSLRLTATPGVKAVVWDKVFSEYGNPLSQKVAEPHGLHVQRLLVLHGASLDFTAFTQVLTAFIDSVQEGDGQSASEQIARLFEGPIAALIDALPLTSTHTGAPVSALAAPINRSARPLRDDVYERILTAIVDGTLEPGEALPDDDLMAWLGTSRMPIRHALDRLAEYGIVDATPHRTVRVAELDAAQINHALDTVSPLVAYAIGATTADVTDEMIATLDQLADDAVHAAAGDQRLRLDIINRAFFDVFVSATANEALRTAVNEMTGLTFRALTPRAGLLNLTAIADHVSRIRDAVRHRDADAAVRAHRHLVEPTYRNFLEMYRTV